MKNTKEPTAWWTIAGDNADKTAVLMAHETQHDAQWHYGMMRTFGGPSYIALSLKATTEKHARTSLEAKGFTVTKVLSGYEGWKETVKVGGAA